MYAVKFAKSLVDWLTDLVDPAALDAEAVLVDRDDLLVLEDGAVVRLDGAQVDGHEERRREDGPHRHLRLGLLVAQAEVADDQLQREAKYIHGMCVRKQIVTSLSSVIASSVY